MRHAFSMLALAALLLAGLAGMDLLARRTDGPGALWVLVRGEPHRLLAGLPGGEDVRILHTWAGGRIVLLHAAVLARATLPEGTAWLVLRASPAALLPACG